MSVDAYLKGKDTRSYLEVDGDGWQVLVSQALARWAGGIQVTQRRRLGRRALAVAVTHRHTPT